MVLLSVTTSLNTKQLISSTSPGSTPVGENIGRLAMRPIMLELGGKDAAMEFLEDADLDLTRQETLLVPIQVSVCLSNVSLRNG